MIWYKSREYVSLVLSTQSSRSSIQIVSELVSNKWVSVSIGSTCVIVGKGNGYVSVMGSVVISAIVSARERERETEH